jgi:hypothetical protein
LPGPEYHAHFIEGIEQKAGKAILAPQMRFLVGIIVAATIAGVFIAAYRLRGQPRYGI